LVSSITPKGDEKVELNYELDKKKNTTIMKPYGLSFISPNDHGLHKNSLLFRVDEFRVSLPQY
jgi:hypothetical protein